MRIHLVLSIKFKCFLVGTKQNKENAYNVMYVFKFSGAMLLCTLTLPMWLMTPTKIADVKDIFYRIS